MNCKSHLTSLVSQESDNFPLEVFSLDAVCSAELMVTEYQKQYFYTDSVADATQRVRDLAAGIQRPFGVRSVARSQAQQLMQD